VEFLISPNPGEEPRPLAKIASGGELSRIMLALRPSWWRAIPSRPWSSTRWTRASAALLPMRSGRKLRKIATRRQVFCITHLAQIASMATSHYGVAKAVKKDRTSTEVRLLGDRERIDEIARMLAERPSPAPRSARRGDDRAGKRVALRIANCGIQERAHSP